METFTILPHAENRFGDERPLNKRELARAADLAEHGIAVEGTIVQVIATGLRFKGNPEFAVSVATRPGEVEPHSAVGLFAVPKPRIPVVGGKVDFWHGVVLDEDVGREDRAFFVLTPRSFDDAHNRGMFAYPD